MNVAWLAPTASGFMAGDYISTSIVPGTPKAFPLFAAAGPPAGSLLHEDMFTADLRVTGGSIQAGSEATQGPTAAPLAGTLTPTAF